MADLSQTTQGIVDQPSEEVARGADECRQLVIEAATHAYLRQGRFSRDYMVGYPANTALVSDRFPFVRAVKKDELGTGGTGWC